MIAKEITVEQFEGFVNGHPQLSFFQTEAMAKRRMHDGWGYVYVGFFDDETLKGVTMLYKRRLLFNKYHYESLGGPIFELEDTEEIFEAFKQYLDNNKVHECLVNPNIVSYLHDVEEDHKVEQNDFTKNLRLIQKVGFNYLENSDQEDSLLNWFYKKDISQFENEKELLDSFERETKRLVSLSLEGNLIFEELEVKDFPRLQNLVNKTATKENFASRNLQYYETLFEEFNKKDEAKFVIVKLDVEAYRKPFEDQIKDLEEKIAKDTETNTKRSLNRANQNQDVLNATKKKLALIADVNDDYIDLCGGVFLFMDHEVVYLIGGSDSRYFSFNGPQFMQWQIMSEALRRAIPTYNFYGTRGSFMGRPNEDGVYFFKKGFNGYLVENFGFFHYEGKGFVNKVIRTLKSLR